MQTFSLKAPPQRAHAVCNGKISSFFPSFLSSLACCLMLLYSHFFIMCSLSSQFLTFSPALFPFCFSFSVTPSFPLSFPSFTFSFHYLVPASFFSLLHSFLYKLLSVSPSLPLAPPSPSPCQSANSPMACSFSSSA